MLEAVFPPSAPTSEGARVARCIYSVARACRPDDRTTRERRTPAGTRIGVGPVDPVAPATR